MNSMNNEQANDLRPSMDAWRAARIEQDREESARMKWFMVVMAACVVAIAASSIVFRATTLFLMAN